MTPSESVYRALFKEEIVKGEKHICEPELAYEMRHGVCNTYRCANPACKYHDSDNGVFISELNIPDYSTPSGFFELKAECEKREWLGDFLAWAWPYDDDYRHATSLCLYLIDTPTTFLTAVHDFLKEKR